MIKAVNFLYKLELKKKTTKVVNFDTNYNFLKKNNYNKSCKFLYKL